MRSRELVPFPISKNGDGYIHFCILHLHFIAVYILCTQKILMGKSDNVGKPHLVNVLYKCDIFNFL